MEAAEALIHKGFWCSMVPFVLKSRSLFLKNTVSVLKLVTVLLNLSVGCNTGPAGYAMSHILKASDRFSLCPCRYSGQRWDIFVYRRQCRGTDGQCLRIEQGLYESRDETWCRVCFPTDGHANSICILWQSL